MKFHILILSFVLGCARFGSAAPSPQDLQFFETKIRPLIAENCYECHSHQSKKLKADLYLDYRQGWLEGGDNGAALVPGDTAQSLVMRLVSYKDPDMQMPPKAKLPETLIADLAKWIELGAPWPDEPPPGEGKAGKKEFDLAKRKAEHWSWRPLSDPKPPAVRHAGWSKHPIDLFVQHGLEENKLAPNEPADRRSLIRRAYLDLVGLPPTPEQVEAFVKDPGKDETAFAKVVDDLLASPHFGERWARHWLDSVRYAESRGHEFDHNAPNAWRYRDYVIRALNADIPYNQFVTEHLAGDLLPEPRLHPEDGSNESILATGFWYLGEWIHSPVDIRQDEADRFDNMIDVATKTFMGLTVACARCHDHKFDAISTKDYYAFHAYLQSTNFRLARYESITGNRAVSRELAALRDQAAPELAKLHATAMKPNLKRITEYLAGAQAVLAYKPGAAAQADPLEAPKTSAHKVLSDFESGSFGGWKVEGDAFGEKPLTRAADYQGHIGFGGKFFVNSHNRIRNGKMESNDSFTGTMTSPDFTISHDYLTFRVGGGSHKDKTCINLLVDGKVVQSTTGKGNNAMSDAAWDLRKYRRMKARIQIVDRVKGGWGNIGADEFVLTNVAPKVAAKGKSAAPAAMDARAVKAVAGANKLDPELLQAWTREWLAAKKDPNHPLHGPVNRKPAPSPTNLDLKGAEVIVDYRTCAPHELIQDGFSFGARPVRTGDLLFGPDPKRPVAGIAVHGGARRDPSWNGLKIVDSIKEAGNLGGYERAGKMLRTPTFEVTDGRISVLAKGRAHCIAVVDSHRLLAGPLHGRTIKKEFIKHDTLKWSGAFDLRRYKGHRVHLEFAPVGDEPLEITLVLQPGPDGSEAFRSQVPSTSARFEAPTPAAVQVGITRAITSLAQGRIESPSEAVLVNWLLSNPELLMNDEAGTWLREKTAPFSAKHADLIGRIRKDSRVAMAMMDGSAETEHVFIRGSWKSPGGKVQRRYLEALGGTAVDPPPTGSGRLELARQITNPKNPYASRVMVNRIWHHLFGRGIVPTTDDFGFLGQRPSHPELLDHLASRFVNEHDWSVKKQIKSVMLSRTYRMSSEAGGAEEELDPTNVWLHRARVRRLQGEVIRDSLLALSGRLDTRLYGNSVPVHLTSFMTGRGRPGAGPLDGNGRRSVYLSVRRNFLSPMMLAFDTPVPFSSMGRRTVSNVPSQALMMMNDPFVIQQADLWAKKMMAEEAETGARIRAMYEQAFARPPSEHELAKAMHFVSTAPDAQETWKDFAHVLFNLKEFIFIN